ncbi:class I SAM-dependent methyltransferase [Akkermansiaceae bacterium]|nr:class I SAM-dependent methyltransferase [Akkermansiaceae bacterium]
MEKPNNNNHRNADYWKEHWQNHPKLSDEDPQMQVARTAQGEPISEENWKKLVGYVGCLLELSSGDRLLDLCCGNGLFSIQFSRHCSSVQSVDFSKPLIDSLAKKCPDNVEVLQCDAREYDAKEGAFDKILFYFAIQHFTEGEIVSIFRKLAKWLPAGGYCVIGDIPDAARIWQFVTTPEYRKEYFELLEAGRPAIGTWFSKDFINYLAIDAGFEKCEIIDQPAYLINSGHCYDVRLTK